MSKREKNLLDRKIAILAANGFEESELFEPKNLFEKEGAEVQILSLKRGRIRAWKKSTWGKSIGVDFAVEDVLPSDYDALILPGGVMNPDQLRLSNAAVDFVRAFAQTGRPIAAICHGPWTLIEAELVEGRNMTSWPSLKTDLRNAGALWSDQEVVVDSGLITSRKPADIPAFVRETIAAIVQGPQLILVKVRNVPSEAAWISH